MSKDNETTENQEERLEALKEMATEMGINFPSNIGLKTLEAKVQAELDKAKELIDEAKNEKNDSNNGVTDEETTETNTDEANTGEDKEATVETEEEEEVGTQDNSETEEEEEETPKNKDGFVPGAILSPEEVLKYRNEQRKKKQG